MDVERVRRWSVTVKYAEPFTERRHLPLSSDSEVKPRVGDDARSSLREAVRTFSPSPSK